MRLKNINLILFLILVIGFIVRVTGIDYGLPFAYHDDEPIIVNYALAYGAGDFDPHVLYISPFLSYVLFFLYGIFFVIGRIAGYFRSVNDFAYLYLNDPTSFYIIARTAYGLLCGAGSVLLAYFVGKKYFNKATGLVGSLFLALNYLHVRDSHYVYFDIPMTFFVLLFLVKACDLLKADARRSDYVYSGILFAAAVSVKYPAALLAVPFFLIMVYNLYLSKGKSLRLKTADVLLCGISCLAVLFALNPFAFIKFGDFFRIITNMPFMEVPAHFHLKTSLFNGCGTAITVLGIFGMFWSVFADRDRKILLAIFVISYYLVVNRSSQPAERLVMPLVPVILLFASSMVIRAKGLVKKKFFADAAAGIVIAALMYPSIVRIYYSDRLFLAEDTRTAAYNWIKENIGKDSRIALDATASWFPKLEKNKEQIAGLSDYFETPQWDKPRGANEKKLKFMLDNPGYPEKTYYLFYIKETAGTAFLSVQPDIAADHQDLVSNNIEYVLLSHTLIDDRYSGFVGDVERNYSLMKVFSPYKEGVDRIIPEEDALPPAAAFKLSELEARKSYGPVIRVYKREQGAGEQ